MLKALNPQILCTNISCSTVSYESVCQYGMLAELSLLEKCFIHCTINSRIICITSVISDIMYKVMAKPWYVLCV